MKKETLLIPDGAPDSAAPDFGTPDSETSASYVLLCDVIVSGDSSAAGLKYDEENMFVPMIILLEKDAAAAALTRAAGEQGIPVIQNIMLAKNLLSRGKPGSPVPEAFCNDVYLVFSRLGTAERRKYRSRGKTHPKNPAGGPLIKKRPPFAIQLGTNLFSLTEEEPGREKLLQEPLNAERKKLKKLLGFAVPPVRVTVNPKLGSDEYRVFFRGLEAGRGRLEIDWYAEKTAENPEGIPLSPPDGKKTASYEPRRIFPGGADLSKSLYAGAIAAAEVVTDHAASIMRYRAGDLLGRDEVQAILDAAEELYPVVTGEVKTLLPLGVIREILQALVSENVSIRHLDIILETLADWGTVGPAPGEIIVEQIRQSLKRQICLDYADDMLTLHVVTLERAMERGFEYRPHSPSRDDDASEADLLADLVTVGALRLMTKGFPPVVLCSPRARQAVKEATRRKLPELAVLSYLEIPPDITVVPLGEIREGGFFRPARPQADLT